MSFSENKILEGPFAGFDLTKLSENDAKILANANTDFILAIQGKKPRYSEIDKSEAVPADGGTKTYHAKHYKITIHQSLSTFGDVTGYIYGPSLVLDKTFARGNMFGCENTRFYTFEDFEEFIKD